MIRSPLLKFLIMHSNPLFVIRKHLACQITEKPYCGYISITIRMNCMQRNLPHYHDIRKARAIVQD